MRAPRAGRAALENFCDGVRGVGKPARQTENYYCHIKSLEGSGQGLADAGCPQVWWDYTEGFQEPPAGAPR
jgi:hypothetical protein